VTDEIHVHDVKDTLEDVTDDDRESNDEESFHNIPISDNVLPLNHRIVYMVL
jgi:hypothetical protein